MITKDLGAVTAYAYAVAGGYEGTEAEFTQLMADLGIVVDEFENFSVNVTTLPAGSQATASYADGVLSLGIPKGDKGDKGNKGDTGLTPALSIGTVETLDPDEDATVTITGTTDAPVLNFGLVKGDKGDQGDVHDGGSYPDLTVGNSEQLLSDNYLLDTDPYTFRASPRGDREFDEIIGASVVENQLVDSSTTSVTLQSGHKYVAKIGGTWSVGSSDGSAITVDGSANDMFIDLTAKLGTTIADHIYSLEQANAGSGVAFYKKYFGDGYKAYDSGSLKSVEGLVSHDTVGFNQWDEEHQLGFWNADGIFISSTSGYMSSKNAIRVLPNVEYCLSVQGATTQTIYICHYDANGTLISRNSISMSGGKLLFTVPQNGAYIQFSTQTFYGTTYKNDICINLSDASINGQYFPYIKHTYPLDSSVTLRGQYKLDANNQLYADGDVYPSSGEIGRNYGEVTLDGTEPWIKSSSYNGNYYVQMGEVVTNRAYAKSVTLNIITNNGLTPISAASELPDNDLCVLIDGGAYPNVNIKNSSKATLEEFKAWLASNPITMVYELATPTTEQADSYQSPQIVSEYGTEEYVSTSVIPIGHSTKYPDNLRKKLDNLPWDFSSIIAPTESGTASRNYTVGQLLIMGNVLYQVTQNIASGGAITPNTNVTATTLSEVIANL